MATKQLGTGILDDGIRTINFFNGRLLSGEDLSQEQIANRISRRHLGQAIGEGIAYGLEVAETMGSSTPALPVVTVQGGLAINRNGQTLALSNAIDLSLVHGVSNGNGTNPAKFGDCDPAVPGVYIAGAGVYLLTIGPAQGTEGRAPVSGLGNGASDCNTRFRIEGVQFRLISLTQQLGVELQEPDRLRNRVAHRCFGTGDARVAAMIANPFGPKPERYGLLDDLRANNSLTRCEVPLAILYWTAAGLQFVDMWAVRRRVTRHALESRWPLLVSDRRAAEGEAIFLQFQAQIDELRTAGVTLSQVEGQRRFKYLPAAGLLPIGSDGGPSGFEYSAFFRQMKPRQPIFIEGAQLRAIVQESFNYPPIDTSTELVIWLYCVRENIQSTVGTLPRPQVYMLFASGHTAFRGEARYNVNHWDFGNFT